MNEEFLFKFRTTILKISELTQQLINSYSRNVIRIPEIVLINFARVTKGEEETIRNYRPPICHQNEECNCRRIIFPEQNPTC